MKILNLIALFSCTVLLLACGSLRRGFDGTSLVSSAKPALSVEVDMPILSFGQISPYLYTAYGYQFPETYIAVYGIDAKTPMAISILSIAPNNWEWDPLSFSTADSPVTSQVFFDGVTFDGSVQIVHGSKDPFTVLVASENELDSIYWIAQRYAYRGFFNQAKVILEYREPLPKVFKNSVSLPLDSPEVQTFRSRAQKAFNVFFGYNETSKPVAPYLRGINSKLLGKYLGSMSVIEPMLFNNK